MSHRENIARIVDIVVEIMHYKEYAAIEEKLRRKGFINDMQSGVICRYTIHGITEGLVLFWEV